MALGNLSPENCAHQFRFANDVHLGRWRFRVSGAPSHGKKTEFRRKCEQLAGMRKAGSVVISRALYRSSPASLASN